jgi:stage V sporulation protein B
MRQFRRFALDVSWVLISSSVNLVLGFALRIILARWLGSFDLGLYTLVLTVQEFATLVAGQGMSSALTKYVAEYREDKEKLHQTIFSAFTVTLIFSVIAALLFYFLADVIAGIFDMPQLARLLRILCLSLPFIIVNQSSLGLENGLRRMKHFAAQIIMRSVLMAAFIITLVWLGYGVEGTVWGLVLSIVGTSLWGLYLARKFYRLAATNFLKNARKMIWFGTQVFSANTVNLLTTHTDNLMIGFFLTATDVGYYSVAVSMCLLFSIIPLSVQRNTYPMTARYWAQNDMSSLQEMFDKSLKYTACILFPLGLLFTFFAREIATAVFGQEYIYSVAPFLILLVARVLRGSTINPVGSSFSGIGRPDIGLKVDTFSLVLNVPLNWIMIPRWGISGAAIATTISLLIGTAIYIKLLPILKVKLDFKWFGLITGAAAAAIGLDWLGSQFINQFVVGGVLLAAYVLFVLMVLLTGEDRALFKSLGSSILKRKKK